jgi:predicted ester cyclase
MLAPLESGMAVKIDSKSQAFRPVALLLEMIPDLHWKIKDLWVSGDRITVSGEATGPPTNPFFGIEPTVSSVYHVEN